MSSHSPSSRRLYKPVKDYDGIPMEIPDPCLRPGMIVVFSLSARGLVVLFKSQNSQAAKQIRELNFTKYLCLICTPSLHDPRPPAEIIETPFIAPPHRISHPSITLTSTSILGRFRGFATPFKPLIAPQYACETGGTRFIADEIDVPENLELLIVLDEGEFCIFDCSCIKDREVIQLTSAYILQKLEGSPKSQQGMGLPVTSPFSSFNFAIDVWTDTSTIEQIPDTAELLKEMTNARRAIECFREEEDLDDSPKDFEPGVEGDARDASTEAEDSAKEIQSKGVEQ
ncbi:hypothetical protein FRB96_006239 [Tulasnella sp. 330]|nr:hypothetical protein FRB96_006239 [Tulasnella sp. 330]